MVEQRPSQSLRNSQHFKFTRRRRGVLLMVIGSALILLPHFWNIADPFGDNRNIAVVSGICSLVLGLVLSLPLIRSERRMSKAASGVLMSLFGVLLIFIAIVMREMNYRMSLMYALVVVGIVVLAVGVVRGLNLKT